MFNKYSKLLSVFLVIAVFSGFLIWPTEAQAGFSLKKLFRSIGRGVKWTVNLPNKATRWMGPVLGPIAANIITGNLASHHKFGQLFTKLQKADKIIRTVEEQKQALGEVKGMYRDQASSIRDQVKMLQEAKDRLSQQLVKTDMTFAEYQDKFIAIHDTINAYEQAADKFDQAANQLGLDDIVKMAGSNLIKDVLGEIKNAVIHEAGQEIKNFLDPNLIKTLIEQGGQGVDGILDILVSGDIDRLQSQGDLDNIDIDALKDKVRDRIKDIIKNNKEDLKNNWSSKLDEVIQQMIAELGEAKDDYTAGDESTPDEEVGDDGEGGYDEEGGELSAYSDDELAEDIKDIPKDEFGCSPGYVWKRMSGVGCVQDDCVESGGHYSYTSACICSFVNPQAGALTKSCVRPFNYIACPGCVYACVAPDSKCPDN